MKQIAPGFARIYVQGREAIVNASTAAIEVAAGRATYEQPKAAGAEKKEAEK